MTEIKESRSEEGVNHLDLFGFARVQKKKKNYKSFPICFL